MSKYTKHVERQLVNLDIGLLHVTSAYPQTLPLLGKLPRPLLVAILRRFLGHYDQVLLCMGLI
jgi:hypothetical protein